MADENSEAPRQQIPSRSGERAHGERTPPRGRGGSRRGGPKKRGRGRGRTGAEHRERRARLREARAAHPVTVTYPPELPVSAAKDEIAEAIRDNQVVIIAGETGSGKTTQLPKICLELGLGVEAMIGHTQPRRIAARTAAERIADELGASRRRSPTRPASR